MKERMEREKIVLVPPAFEVAPPGKKRISNQDPPPVKFVFPETKEKAVSWVKEKVIRPFRSDFSFLTFFDINSAHKKNEKARTR